MKAALARLFAVGKNSRSVNIALLLLRIMVATNLIYHHGVDKITDWNMLITRPLDPIHIGVVPSLLFAGFADIVCASCVLFGFATRIASFFNLVVLSTVFFIMYHALTTPYWPVPHTYRAELVWQYMAAMVAIIIAGPGRYSIDGKLALFQDKTTSKATMISGD